MRLKDKLPNFSFELELWNKGYEYVIGLDEVGRGAFAGPVVAAGVIFPKKCKVFDKRINDSKKLLPNLRTILSEIIKNNTLCFSVQEISVSCINKDGIGKATNKAFRKVVIHLQQQLKRKQIAALIDGFHIKYIRGIPIASQKAIIKGDSKSVSIAAASILAKVYRDGLMEQLDRKFPEYGFAKHKGYGTANHQKAIFEFGLSKLHRRSFRLEKFLPK